MFIPCHNCFLAKSVSLYCSCIICFLTTHFFTPFAFLCFFRRVHFRSQTDALCYGGSIAFVFHFAQNLFVGVWIKWMPFRKVARVVQVFVGFYVFVDVFHFDLKKEAVRVCVQKLAPGAVFFFLARCRKNRTSGSCCCQAYSYRCRPVCSEAACFYACRSLPGRLKIWHALGTKDLQPISLFCPSNCCALSSCQRFCRTQSCSLACKSSFRSRSSRFC